MIRNNVGKLIEIAMVEKNLTQKNLAEKLNVKQSMISQWINEKSNPKVRTLNKIAEALGISLNYFIEEEKSNIKSDITTKELLEEKTKRHDTEIELLKKEIENLKKEIDRLKRK